MIYNSYIWNKQDNVVLICCRKMYEFTEKYLRMCRNGFHKGWIIKLYETFEVLIGALGVLCCFEKIYVKIIRFISWVRTSSEDIYVSLRWLIMVQAYSKIWPQIFDFYLEVWFGWRPHACCHTQLTSITISNSWLLAHAASQPSTIAWGWEVSKPNRGGYPP